MKPLWARLIVTLVLTALAQGLGAQTDDIEAGFKKPDAAEAQRLRAVLAEPVPQDALQETLRRHLRDKEAAANALGDDVQLEALLREAVRLLPDSHLKNNLARKLLVKGQWEDGNALMRQAIATAENPYQTALWSANMACDLYDQNKNEAARAMLADVARQVSKAQRNAKTDWAQRELFRAASRSAYCLSLLEQRFGRNTQAIEAAGRAEQNARRALALLATELKPTSILFTQVGVANSLARKLQAYRAGGRLQDAEKALADYMRFSREVQLPADYLAAIYATAGNLRFSQREFGPSEQLMRKSDAVLEGLGREPAHTKRTSYRRDIFIALAGQKKWPAALQELDRLDRLAGDDAKLKKQVLYRFDRAVVYFGNQRYAEAAALFESHAQELGKLYGDSHFFVAQALGLQGAALWRTGRPESRAKAVPLLKTAVRDYMAPVNADYLENIGYRKERREEVFAAYLDAMANTPGEDATQAMGAADWVRGSLVQESLSDAAVRAAAGTPALTDVVRREQDAKNEVAGLRRYLAGEAGGAASALPEVAAQMRERIAVLEGQRVQLQADIKAQFPDYASLVRPALPTVQDIARQLEPQQALLMLWPTTDAVYVWAVAADRPAAFVRAKLTAAQVNTLVAGLRRQLDFAADPDVGSRFDGAAAFTLYNQLLAPLAAVWQGKKQLVVAAGGALSQLPFGVLHTRAGGGFDDQAPWLIRQASIAQVPSLSAWLAIKAIAKRKSAPDAFAGWGDPFFGVSLASAAPAVSLGAVPFRSLALTRATVLADLEAPEKTVLPPSAFQYARIPALPDTRAELLAIAGTLKADTEHDVMLGERATRESVLAASRAGLLADKRVLAFATHGLMAGDLPNLTQPALAMAATGAERDNPLAPLLTLEDVLTLKLNADWVVLSACNTAAADGKAEEALSGLARGFFYAGSRSLLVTHWSVESASATLLTTSTFAHYTANPSAPKAESLRQAMLKVMAVPQYAHPAYWAPYVLVGDGGR